MGAGESLGCLATATGGRPCSAAGAARARGAAWASAWEDRAVPLSTSACSKEAWEWDETMLGGRCLRQ